MGSVISKKYGARIEYRLTLTELLRTVLGDHFGGRIEAVAEALRVAKAAMEDSHKYIWERLQRKANLGMLSVGDSVVVAVHDRVTMTSRWDPHWEVTRVSRSGSVRTQIRIRAVNREKGPLVEPTLPGMKVNPSPRRIIRK